MSEAPQYFKDFLVDFKKGRDEVNEIKSSLEEAWIEWRDEAALNRAILMTFVTSRIMQRLSISSRS